MCGMAHSIDAAIAELAATQHSAFSLDQARTANISRGALRRRVDAGALLVPRPNVFVVAGAQPTWHTEVMVAVLWAGPGAFASHRTAAELRRVDGIRTRDVIDVTVPRGRFPVAPGIVTHRTLIITPADVSTVHGIPTATPVRILCDAGVVVGKRELELGLEDMYRRGYLTPEYVYRQLERLGGLDRKGGRPLTEVLNVRDPSWAPLESVLEFEAWEMIREADVRLPIRQHEVIIDGEKFRIDMLFLPEMLAVEPSGFRWHSGRLKWGIDRRRERMLVSMGYRIFPVTWNDVKYERAETIRLLRRALSVAA
jgi:hypothetical protein